MAKILYLSSCKQPSFFTNLTELEFSIQIFEKRLNNKFHENTSNCIKAVTFGQI